MLTVQYTGKQERTVGIGVVYPGELLQTTPPMLAAWRAEYGDVFVVVSGALPAAEPDATGTPEGATQGKGQRK